MITAMPGEKSFANFFRSKDSSGFEILSSQNQKGTKTLNSLSIFYKEFQTLENEYSRRFTSLVKKLNISKHEYGGSLQGSLETFQEQCTKIAEAHSLQSRRVNDSLQIPLLELIGERKAREKSLEAKVQQVWLQLSDYKGKCDSKSLKYEKIWKEINTLKSTRLTLDNREAQKLQEKINALKQKMYVIREENYELTRKYNEQLDHWLSLWWDSCNELQVSEEKRIKFLKRSLWEFANIESTFSVEQDQYAENIRSSLQECSAERDIASFINEFQTGDNMLAPLEFIDFANNQSRPVVMETTRKFNINDIPSIREKIEKQHQSRQKKKNPPPKVDELTDMAFEMIGKSKETFKELQEQAQKEVSQMKLSTPHEIDSKSVSEPSTFKVMSDYSTHTDQTSVLSQDANASFENDIDLHIAHLNKPQAGDDSFDRSDISESHDCLEKKNNVPLSEAGTIHTSNHEKTFSVKNDILRESMSPTKKTNSRTAKLNTFANLVKNKFEIAPQNQNCTKISRLGNRLSSNSLMLSPEEIEKSRIALAPQRKLSNGMKKSKSQYNFENKHVNMEYLPSFSSEGFPVIVHCRAKYSYTPAIPEELAFKKRDILLILHKQPDGWWFAENMRTGDSGVAPSNYLTEI